MFSLESLFSVQDRNSQIHDEDSVLAATNIYLEQMFASEQGIEDGIELLKAFKCSGFNRQRDIYTCMVSNLLNEYQNISSFPEREVRMTGIIYGKLIQEHLISDTTLAIAMRYILEALRIKQNGDGEGKMFRFGLFALHQFKGRLHEWPQYSSHLVQIPHFQDEYCELAREETKLKNTFTSAACIRMLCFRESTMFLSEKKKRKMARAFFGICVGIYLYSCTGHLIHLWA